eukprot:TRINITY_DN2893_c0_g1_i1.p1 TRINITY_DN2893_c0_g1~~TRINITY_DN2893_c0_g1_i1.p1  ORF type:complete len:394 (-),score=42.95 TRINITY_DN2893_c0_g1_i1:4-1185(-)
MEKPKYTLPYQEYYHTLIEDAPIQVQWISETKGKGLFATKHIKEGDCIYQETPLVSAQLLWNKKNGFLACLHCQKSLETPINMARRLSEKHDLPELEFSSCSNNDTSLYVKCDNCNEIFCSEECKEQANELHHRILCTHNDPEHPVLKLQESWMSMHHPPEALSIMLVARIYASIIQAMDNDLTKEESIKPFTIFHTIQPNNKSSIDMFKFLKGDFEQNLEKLHQLIVKAIYDKRVDDWFSFEGFKKVVGIVAFNGLGIGTSSLDEYYQNLLELDSPNKNSALEKINSIFALAQEKSSDLVCDGSGLFEVLSTCNHNCVPNVCVAYPFNDYTACLMAKRNIKPGEELCLCYLDRKDVEENFLTRKELLKGFYGFECDCEKCLKQCDCEKCLDE